MSAASTVRAFGLTLLGLAFLMPAHHLPWASFHGQWVAALGVTLVVLGAACAAGAAGWSLPRPPLALLALAAAIVPWVQWIAGRQSFFSDAALASSYFAGFGLSVIGGAIWARQGRQGWLDRLFAALTVAAALSAAVALMQWLSIEAGQAWVAAAPPGARPVANLGQPNHLALLLALGLVGTWRALGRRLIGGAAAAALTAWLGLGLVMTQSRTGWLIVGVLVLWWALQRRRMPALTPRPVIVGLVLFVLAILSWDTINEALRLSQASNLGERLQSGPRDLIWRAMWIAAKDSPWIGYGFNQIIIAHQTVALDAAPVQRMIESAHNLPLDLALWAGVPFALVLGCGVAGWLVTKALNCRDLDDWSVLASVLAMLTHAMLEFPLEHAYFLLPLGLLMGSFESSPLGHPRQRTAAWPLAAITLLMIALVTWIGAEYLRVEQANLSARMALLGIGDPNGVDAAPPDVVLLDAPREYHRLMLTRAREGMSGDELDWMRRVTQRHAFPPAMLRYALAAGLNGRPGEAGLTLRRLCSMHLAPRCDEAREAWRSAQTHWPTLAAVPAP